MDQLSSIYAARPITGGLLDPARREDDGAAAATRDTVAVLAAASGADPRAELARLGVGFVVLQQSDTAAELLARKIDSVPGLAAVGRTDAGWLWRVVPEGSEEDPAAGTLTSRVRVVDASGKLLQTVDSSWVSAGATVPEGPSGRTVLLAERINPGWRATLDGQQLDVADNGWAQGFRIPENAGGELRIWLSNPWGLWIGTVQVLLIGITVLLAVPIPARRRFVPRRIDHVKTTGSDSSPGELLVAAHEIDSIEDYRGDGQAEAPDDGREESPAAGHRDGAAPDNERADDDRRDDSVPATAGKDA